MFYDMNKNTLLLFIFFAFHLSSLAQVCTGDFTFFSQQDIDEFLVNNPTCTSIEGNVQITSPLDNVSPFITNVDALQNIQHISGNLIIEMYQGPFSLQGLSSLTAVGGELWIYDIGGEPSLTSFEGLENLTAVNKLSLNIRTSLDFTPFDALASADNIDIIISNDISAANQYTEIHDVFPLIEHLDGGFTIGVSDPNVAVDFSGFYNLYSAGNLYFNWYGNPYMNFSSFNAFNNLETCNNLTLDFCMINDFIDGFSHLTNVTNSLWCDLITSDGDYPNFSQLQQAASLSIIGGSDTLPDFHFPYLTEVPNGVLFSAVFSSAYFEVLQSTGSLNINGEEWLIPQTTSFYAPLLDSVYGSFQLVGMEISDLSGFPELDFIGGDVSIFNCTQLSNCSVNAMCEKISYDAASVYLDNNASGCSTIDEVLDACSISYVTGHVYADLNCDGILNGNDIPLANSIIHDQNNLPIGSTFMNGEFYAGLPDNSTTVIHAMVPSGLLSGPEYTFTTTNLDEVFSNYDFPLCPDLNFHDVRVYSVSGQPRPGFYLGYQVLVVNDAFPTENVLVSFDLTNMPGASIFSTNGTINGNTVTWTGNDLVFMETNQFYVQIYVDPTTPLGTIYTPSVTATLLSAAADDEPSNNVFSFNQTVVNSYDPNDKQVNSSTVNYGEISSTDQITLDYAIRFQNTGTAEAINVRVDDIIEEDLDLSTFQMLDASHPFQLTFDENRKVEWLFENIMLPDSDSNEPASHGFIHFKIKTKDNLQLTDVIENSVAIYFDYNEPVITNTATTSFYVCPAQVSISGVEAICQNEEVTLTASENWNAYSWTLNGNQVSSTNVFYSNSLNVGSNELQLESSTDLCSSNTSFTVDVFPTPTTPVITQNGNTLTATGTGTYTWTLNGEVLSDTDSSIEMTETGNYGVSYVDVCPSLPTSGLFEFVGVNEWKASERILISPNPTKDATTITLPSAWTGQNEITLFDAIGKAVINEKISASKFTWQLSTLPKGCYQVLVTNTFSGESISSKLVLE
jgi:uncharacterized repeat protein (TIGR01451 family)